MPASFAAKFLERESGIFRDFQKQSLWKISAMHWNYKQGPLRMFEN
jgi:hypothetical protein